MAITIAVESPLQDEVRTLIAELNAVLLTLSPPEACYHLTVEEMAEPTVTVWIARDGDTIIGCGALKRHFETVGEVKRMFTRPTVRGQRVGSALLEAITALAKAKGVTRLVLETGAGEAFADAYRLYERSGFTRCGVLLDYPDSEHSAFYEKWLAIAPAQ